MGEAISEALKSIPTTLQSFASDDHAIVALALILISLMCTVLFYRAPIWPRSIVFSFAAVLMTGGALFVVLSENRVQEGPNPNVPQSESKYFGALTPDHVCMVIQEGGVKCWVNRPGFTGE